MQALLDWSAQGGEAKAGLPANASASFISEAKDVVAQLAVSGNTLNALSHTWQNLEAERGARGKDLLKAARAAEQAAGRLSTEMSQFQVEITVFGRTLKQHAKNVDKQLNELNAQLTVLKAQVNIAQTSLTMLNARLKHEQDRADDADSILLGIISFGGTAIARVIEIKKLRDAAVVQMHLLIASRTQLAAKVANINAVKPWVDQTVRLTNSVKEAEVVATAYHNRLSNMIGDLGDAVDDEEKVLSTTREQVAAYYERQVGKELMAVFAEA